MRHPSWVDTVLGALQHISTITGTKAFLCPCSLSFVSGFPSTLYLISA